MNRRTVRVFVSIAFAVAVGLALTSWAAAQNATATAAATPRTPDGKPDLSGMWGGGGGGGGGAEDDKGNITTNVASRRCTPNQKKCDEHTNQSYDQEFTGRMDRNRPLYKPEFWDRVQYLDYNTNNEDPIFKCQPEGITRMGAPAKIVQTANEIIFFYASGEDFRIIPTDGRTHDPIRSKDVTFFGDAVGRWEGDTLVIDSVGFNDLTWLARGGYFHSDKMHLIERFRREGNALHYEVTVEDSEVLLQPWVMNPRDIRLNTNPKALIPEGDPCHDYDSANMVSKIRH